MEQPMDKSKITENSDAQSAWVTSTESDDDDDYFPFNPKEIQTKIHVGREQYKRALIARDLSEFVSSSPGQWSLEQISQNQWKLDCKIPNLVFQPLHPALSRQHQHLCNTLHLNSTVTVAVGPDAIWIEENHEFSHLTLAPQTPISYAISVQKLFPVLSNILMSWPIQFSLLRRFLDSLKSLLTSRKVTAHLQTAMDCPDLRLSIGKVQLSCQLMPPCQDRPSVVVQLLTDAESHKFKISDFNFHKSIQLVLNTLLKHSNLMMMRPGMIKTEDHLTSQRRELVETELDKIRAANNSLVVSASSEGHQWIIKPRQPFCLLRKIALKMQLCSDKEFCLQPLQSSLTITLLTLPNTSEQCILNELHQLWDSKVNRSNKFEWRQKDADEVVFPQISSILNSWASQFTLMDLFCTGLAQFLAEKDLSISLRSERCAVPFRALNFQIENTRLQCQMITHWTQRPLIIVHHNYSYVQASFRIRDSPSLNDAMMDLEHLISEEKSAGKKRKRKPNKRSQTKSKKSEPGPSQQQFNEPLKAELQELKSILLQPTQQPALDQNSFEEQLKIMQQSGFDVMLSTATMLKTIQVGNGENVLSVEFLEMRDYVSWKLRLKRVAASNAVLLAKGSSVDFFGALLICLQRFFGQKQGAFIKVEVEVDSEVGSAEDQTDKTEGSLKKE